MSERTSARPGRLGVGVVGAGRVGAVLGAALRTVGHTVVGASAVSEASKDRIDALLPGVPVLPVEAVVERAELVLLTVPDDALPDLVSGLADLGRWQPGQIVLHTSGRYGTEVLEPAARAGAIPLAVHPAMTFTGTSLDLARVTGCPFAVTAAPVVLPIAQALVVEIGGEPVVLDQEVRPAYHAALAHGANHLVTLVTQAERVLEVCGVEEPRTLLTPLLGAALDGALRSGEAELTGPVVRGDVGTVRAHLAALAATGQADVVQTYRQLARVTTQRALAARRVGEPVAAALLDALAAPPAPGGEHARGEHAPGAGHAPGAEPGAEHAPGANSVEPMGADDPQRLDKVGVRGGADGSEPHGDAPHGGEPHGDAPHGDAPTGGVPRAGAPEGTSRHPVVVRTREELSRALGGLPGRRGLVMTMGALHDGHRELVRTTRQRADHVVVSVFVNPLQFGPGEDYEAYPRDLAADVAVLAEEGVDVVFAPSEAEMYPTEPLVRIDPGPVATVLEGRTRPTHFAGVLQVVHKVFNLVRPDVTAFGRKDAQQLALVRTMVRDLDMAVEVVAVPIRREDDGLALSSRNAYLSADERTQALALSAALRAAQEVGRDGGDPAAVHAAAEDVLRAAEGVRVDYLALVDPDTFLPVDSVEEPRQGLLAVAAWVGPTRLIDNMLVDLRPRPHGKR